jgi:adenosine deaminase
MIRSADDVRRIIQEAAEDDVAEGSGWLELQGDPSSYARHLGGINPAVEVMVDACRATGIGIGLVLAVSWGASPEHAEHVAGRGSVRAPRRLGRVRAELNRAMACE